MTEVQKRTLRTFERAEKEETKRKEKKEDASAAKAASDARPSKGGSRCSGAGNVRLARRAALKSLTRSIGEMTASSQRPQDASGALPRPIALSNRPENDSQNSLKRTKLKPLRVAVSGGANEPRLVLFAALAVSSAWGANLCLWVLTARFLFDRKLSNSYTTKWDGLAAHGTGRALDSLMANAMYFLHLAKGWLRFFAAFFPSGFGF